MAVTNFSPLLGLALPTTGDLSGTWGTVFNDAITGLLDSAIAGTTTLSTDADVTLSTTNGVANQERNAVLRWTAGGTTTRNITAPAQSKAYIVINDTSGSQSVVLRGVGPTTGVTVVAGERCVAAWDGSDFVKIATSTADGVTSVDVSGGTTGLTTSGGPVTSTGTITLAGVLTETNGGTGESTYTDGELLIGNSSSGLTKATLTAGTGVAITNGDGAITINATGTGGTVTSVDLSGGTTGLTVSGNPITTSGTITLDGTLAVANGGTGATTSTGSGAVVLASSPTITNLVLEGSYTEEVYALGTSGSLALNPANGSIQTCALSGAPTFTDSLTSGQSLVLMLTGAATYPPTFPTITWVTSGGNVAPTLTAADTLVFWKISTTLYGAYVGNYV